MITILYNFQFWLFFDNILSASVGMISQTPPKKPLPKIRKKELKTEHAVV